MMDTHSIDACLLRSVCNNLFVHETDRKEASFVFPDLPRTVLSVPVWRDCLATACRKTNLYPPTIAFPSGPVYGLGTNYDEACSAEGVSSIFDLPPSTGMDDVVRDKVALCIGCPDALVNILYEMGSFVAIVGEGAEKLSADLNWEACITLTKSHRRDAGLTDWLCSEVGGADYVVAAGAIDPDVAAMIALRCGEYFVMGDGEDANPPSWAHRITRDDPKRMMQVLCGVLRDKK